MPLQYWSPARPRSVVLAHTCYPGWEATVDGRPAELSRANYAFRAVALPASSGAVQMVWRPAGFVWGGLATVLAASLLFGIGIKGVYAGIFTQRA